MTDMTTRQLTHRKMTIHESITTDRIIEAIQLDEYAGFCMACGNEQGGCEPDARGYRCESCDEPAVYGAEELLFRFIA
jgi:hypothetical protein